MVNFTMEILNLSHTEGVITKVHWAVTGELNGKSSTSKGVVDLDPTGASDFIPYHSVTKEIVVAWIAMRMFDTLVIVEKKITKELTPVVTETLGTPW